MDQISNSHNKYMLLIFYLIFSVHSIIVKDLELSLSPFQYNSIVWFGFQQGGNLNITAYLKTTSDLLKSNEIVDLYLCTPENYKNLGSLSDDCKLVHPKLSTKNSIWYKKSIDVYITYEFVFYNKINETVSLSINYEITNPGGEQLSAGILEMKYMMLAFSVAWGLLIIVWALEWLCNKRKRPTLVQTLLILNCVFWCLASIIFNFYLYDFSEKGKSNPKWLMATRIAMYTCLISLFLLLEIISNSISITKSSLSKPILIKLLIITLVYLIWCLLSELNHGGYVYYLLSSIYIIFMIIYLIDIRRVLRELEASIEEMQNEGKEVIESSIWHQIRMFRMYSISLLIFLAALACISALYTFYMYIPWIGIGTQVYVIFLWIFFLSLYFRFRQSSPYSWADCNKI